MLVDAGFRRAISSPVAFYHVELDVHGVVHGDDFVFTGVDEALDVVLKLLRDNYEIKDRGRLGSGPKDVKVIDILGQRVRLHDWGLSWEADSRHRLMVMEYFGLDEGSKVLSKNGYKADRGGARRRRALF